MQELCNMWLIFFRFLSIIMTLNIIHIGDKGLV